jgi:hypothetical protein
MERQLGRRLGSSGLRTRLPTAESSPELAPTRSHHAGDPQQDDGCRQDRDSGHQPAVAHPAGDEPPGVARDRVEVGRAQAPGPFDLDRPQAAAGDVGGVDLAARLDVVGREGAAQVAEDRGFELEGERPVGSACRSSRPR